MIWNTVIMERKIRTRFFKPYRIYAYYCFKNGFVCLSFCKSQKAISCYVKTQTKRYVEDATRNLRNTWSSPNSTMRSRYWNYGHIQSEEKICIKNVFWTCWQRPYLLFLPKMTTAVIAIVVMQAESRKPFIRW